MKYTKQFRYSQSKSPFVQTIDQIDLFISKIKDAVSPAMWPSSRVEFDEDGFTVTFPADTDHGLVYSQEELYNFGENNKPHNRAY